MEFRKKQQKIREIEFIKRVLKLRSVAPEKTIKTMSDLCQLVFMLHEAGEKL
jgi:hypothetical protein